MKYRGRITLFILSLVTSFVFFIEGDERGTFFYIFSIFHAAFSWVFGGWYDKAKFLSFHDPLTGVYNRRYALKVFEKKFQSAMKRDEKVGILNIDVNNFKLINDTFGHAYGDFVLKEISQLIKKSVGKDDVLARWGGDEFLVLFVNRDKESAKQLIERIHETIEASVRENKIDITLSIGISLYPDDTNSLLELIALADERMYKMKNLTKSIDQSNAN